MQICVNFNSKSNWIEIHKTSSFDLLFQICIKFNSIEVAIFDLLIYLNIVKEVINDLTSN